MNSEEQKRYSICQKKKHLEVKDENVQGKNQRSCSDEYLFGIFAVNRYYQFIISSEYFAFPQSPF